MNELLDNESFDYLQELFGDLELSGNDQPTSTNYVMVTDARLQELVQGVVPTSNKTGALVSFKSS